MPNVSIREAAAQVGVSHVALINARNRGAWQAEPDGTVDMDRLMKSEWALSRAAKGERGRSVQLMHRPATVAAPPSPIAAVPSELAQVEAPAQAAAPRQEPEADLFAEADPGDMQAVLLRPKIDIEKLKLAEQWRRQRLDNDEQEKKLVRSDVVESAVEGRFREDAEALLNWPARISAQMAAELGVEEQLMSVVLEKYVRDFMQERSKCPTGLAA